MVSVNNSELRRMKSNLSEQGSYFDNFKNETYNKGTERYIVFYEKGKEVRAIRAFGRFAMNPELSFDWYDASVVSKNIREKTEKAKVENSRM